jgi:ATP-dependent Clp protease protease subunit
MQSLDTPALPPLTTGVPDVTAQNGTGMEPSADIYARFLKNRIVFLGSEVNDQVANVIVAQLLYLAQDDPDREIQLYINSPGGSVDAGLAIYDTMNLITPAVTTSCIGMAASMGAWLLAAGAKGKRTALPNSRILIHQGSSGFRGTASDIEVHARETLRLESRMVELLAADTGQTAARIRKDIDHDYWMSAKEALEYGMIDAIIGETEKSVAADKAEAALNLSQ